MENDIQLDLSGNDGIYGEVSTKHGALQVLISKPDDDGIRVVKGGMSRFKFFVFVPQSIFDELIEAYDETVFQQAVLHIAELLLRPDDGIINEQGGTK